MAGDNPPGERATRVVSNGAELRIEGDRIRADRKARLYLQSMMGGRLEEYGWQIPIRNRSADDLTLQVTRWLQRNGWLPSLEGEAAATFESDERRRKSFERTVEAARSLRDTGATSVSQADIDKLLLDAGWNFAARTLRPHQVGAVVHGLTAGNAANFSVPGAGKTASTLALAAAQLTSQAIELVVVVGPLSCFRPWETEAELALPTVRTRRIRGGAQVRRDRIRALEPTDIALMTYASAASDQGALVEIMRRYRTLLVVDESHRIKRFRGGTWAPAISRIAREAVARVILSGTPMPQSGRDLFSQLNVLWPGRELTGPRERFASAVRDNFPVILDQVLPFVTRTPKSALGLPPPRVHHIPVEMGTEEGDIYRLVVENFRNRVGSATNSADANQLDALRRGRPIRLLQAATNVALLRTGVTHGEGGYDNSPDTSPTLLSRLQRFDERSTPPAKFVAALRLINELDANQKAVVWSAFVANLDSFSDFARDQSNAQVFQVDGRVPAGNEDDPSTATEEFETREQVISRFLSYPGKAVLVTNPASCSESISLHQSCHNAIYLDRTYDCAQWLQSIDRIHRLGLPEGVTVDVHVLQSVFAGEPTVDDLVEASLSQKEAIMRALLEGAELAPFEQSDDPMVDAEGNETDLRNLLNYLLGF